ncbi:MAG TPA: TylF/MycF/NovP-related O-methyltransferase [Actinomycetota bacterium]|nr:TylF/MycF/NovP-related O-methyltransferase [Actinomycetota bacterium]
MTRSESGARARLKHLIPPSILNRTLLMLPGLYRTRLVNYETNLSPVGVEELLEHLRPALRSAGNVIECGSSRAGATALMAGVVKELAPEKKIYACDSFEGFDPAELDRERAAGMTVADHDAFRSTSLTYVKEKLRKLKIDDVVEPVPGYFENTLGRITDSFCFALIDCDLKDSLLTCAEEIWPRLVPGGTMMFDDYASVEFRGARSGVDGFVAAHSSELAEHRLLDRLYLVVKKTNAL